MLRYLPLVLNNCWRNRRRTILTIASMAVSMCVLGVMIAMYHAVYLTGTTPQQALRLITRNRISFVIPIPQAYSERIRKIPGVREVMYSQWFGGTYKDNRLAINRFARYAIEPKKLFAVYSELRLPDDQRKAFERERTACLIGRELSNGLNLHLGDRITIVGDVFPGNYEFTVRGIFDSPRVSNVLYFDRDYLDPARRVFVNTLVVLVDNSDAAARVPTLVDSQFRNAGIQTRTEPEQAFALSFVALLGNVRMFLIGICAAVMFTIMVVAGNTMALAARERTREIGVLKALGFTAGRILSLIVGEACMLSLIGGAIGFLLSILLISVIAKSPIGDYLPPFKLFEPQVALACALAAAAIGVVSSFVPAWGASHIPIVRALRSAD